LRHDLDELPFLYQFLNCHGWKVADTHTRQKGGCETGWVIGPTERVRFSE
jgi:hypothetical protein